MKFLIVRRYAWKVWNYPTVLFGRISLQLSPVTEVNPPGLVSTAEDRVEVPVRKVEAGPLDGVDPLGRGAEETRECDGPDLRQLV